MQEMNIDKIDFCDIIWHYWKKMNKRIGDNMWRSICGFEGENA